MERRKRNFQQFLFLGFLLSLWSGSTPAQEEKVDPWKKDIDAVVASEAANPPPKHAVLFIGSSSIRMWTTLARDFPGVPVINHGFGGSRIADATRNVDRLVVPYVPDLVVLYAGDNDIAEGRTTEQTVGDFKDFVARVHRDLPKVPILFVSIKPSVARFALWPRMRAGNEGISAWAKTQRNVIYVDVASKMLDADGQPRPELLLPDGLHMQPAGYAIWVEALNPWVKPHAVPQHK